MSVLLASLFYKLASRRHSSQYKHENAKERLTPGPTSSISIFGDGSDRDDL